MANYNRVIIAGNLTRDVELKFTPKGTAVARLSMAINRDWKNEAGEKQSEVTFVDVDVFGRQAEVISQYVKKGRPLLVEGRLKLDQWEKDGVKQSKLKVVLESFSFIDGKAESGESAPRQERAPAPAASQAADDDVAF